MKKKIIFLVVGISLFSGILYFVSNKIRISTVKCESQFGGCSKEVYGVISKYVGNSYFDTKKTLGDDLSRNSRVEKYSIRFNFPSELLVEVLEKKPEVALKFGEQKYFLFDKEGNVVGETTETQLPTALVIEVPNDQYVQFAVKLSRDLFKYYNVHDTTLEKFGLTANIRGVEVTFPLEGDTDVILGSMEVSLLQLKRLPEDSTISQQSGKIYTVDLRYKNPVIASK